MREKAILSGFSVFFFPDKVFMETVKERGAFQTFLRVFFFSLFFSAVTIHVFRILELHAARIPAPEYLAGILIIYVLEIFICAVIAFFLDLLYSNTIKIQGNKVSADFKGGFLCRLFLMPLWAMVIMSCLFSKLPKAGFLYLFLIAVIILRLLDMEARLLKAVYGFKLAQGYVVVVLQSWLLVLGMMLGHFLLNRTAIF